MDHFPRVFSGKCSGEMLRGKAFIRNMLRKWTIYPEDAPEKLTIHPENAPEIDNLSGNAPGMDRYSRAFVFDQCGKCFIDAMPIGHPGACSAPGKTWGVPFVDTKDSLWEPRENSSSAREARWEEFGVFPLWKQRNPFEHKKKVPIGIAL